MSNFAINGREQGLHGDLTTTGAMCVTSLPNARGEASRGALRLGDKTTPCKQCGQIGEIIEGESTFTWNGIPTALHGALVLCGCPPGTNRLIAPARKRSSAGMNSAPAAATENTSTPFSPYAASQGEMTFARAFAITDSETGLPLVNRKFIAVVDGYKSSGFTDANGIAHLVAPSADSVISLHVLFRSPARELTELEGITTRPITTTTRVEEMQYGQTPRPIAITINDRAATREAIIQKVRGLGHEFVERSEWHAEQPKKTLDRDWDYSMIALHHAGRSYSCSSGSKQMLDTQALQQDRNFEDIGYHFGIDCSGAVYEGRDIRFKGEHLLKYNSSAIGIVLLNNLSTTEEGKDLVTLARKALDHVGFSTTNQIPALQINATINLITALKSVFHVEYFGGHREFPYQTNDEGKICPGNVGMKLVKFVRAKTRLHKPMKP